VNTYSKIAFLVLTFNNANCVRRCLASLSQFSLPIYVVDSGSSDSTKEIVSEFANVSFFEIVPFISQKTQIELFISSQVDIIRGIDWLFRIDSDEFLPPQSISIESFLSEQPRDVSVVDVCLHREFMGRRLRHGTLRRRWIPRIWRPGLALFDCKNMDERVLPVLSTKSIRSSITVVDSSLLSPVDYCAKHLLYVQRQIFDLELDASGSLRERFYYILPPAISPLLYFAYRYIFRLGFLDGSPGFYFHFFQCLWYRTLVSAQQYYDSDLTNRSHR
jgi:glycosyltransferase involved in cell wall biosynthesis